MVPTNQKALAVEDTDPLVEMVQCALEHLRLLLDQAGALAAFEAHDLRDIGLENDGATGVRAVLAHLHPAVFRQTNVENGMALPMKTQAVFAPGFGRGAGFEVEIGAFADQVDVLRELGSSVERRPDVWHVLAEPAVEHYQPVAFVEHRETLIDGLDGLATVPVMIAAGAYGLIVYLVGSTVYADYLQVPYVPGAGELAIICGAIIGAGLGFLWFNAPPAMIFMGDTGSLALGGAIGTIAVAAKHEIVLAIVGGLFVLEGMSVMIQIASFKLFGKRVFRMAPIHHHFEQLGWKEPTIVIRFWIIAVILALIGLATLKLR